ncbi:MAG: hypothetical protein ACLQMF_13295 [Rectinemataceae bacterium]
MTVFPSSDRRQTMTTMGEVIACKIVARLCAIPAISKKLNGEILDEMRRVVVAELNEAFKLGGEDLPNEEPKI